MKVDIFTLCDNAQQYEGGKLVIVGTFNSIYAKKYPMRLSSLALVARILFDKSEIGKHKISFSIKKVGSEEFILPVGTMEADIKSVEEANKTVNLVINGNGIMVPAEGTYEVLLRIDEYTQSTLLFARIRE